MRGPSRATLLLLLAACGQGTVPPPPSGVTAAGGARSVAAASPRDVVVRRIWAGPDVDFQGSPAPDGRSFTFNHVETGNLAVRDVATGQVRLLTAGSWETDQFSEVSVVSPDGRQVAYTWFTDGAYELRVVGMDGSGERTLFRDPENTTYVEPSAWSPDGERVLIGATRADGSNQLLLVPTRGGAPRALRSFDWRWPGDAGFSPDGRFIAFSFPPDERSHDRDLYLLAVEGHQERNLTASAADERLLGWLPDGSGLLFVSRSGAREGFWTLPLSDGRPAGDPLLVKADAWRVSGIGLSRSALFFGVTVEQGQVYTAVVDVEHARLLEDPVPVSDASLGRASAPAWSPDGSHLAYLQQSAPASARAQTLVIRSLESGQVRDLRPSLEYTIGFTWAGDGRALFASGSREGRHGIYRVDLQSGEAQLVSGASPRGGSVFPPALSPDGGTLYFRRDDEFDGAATGIVAHDLTTASERMVYRGRVGGLSLSPDGKRIAFVPAGGHSILLLPAEAGRDGSGEAPEPLALLRFTEALPGGNLGGLTWSPDGRYLLFVTRLGVDFELRRVPLAGGEPATILTMRYLRGIRVSPDGRRIAFMAGEFRGEVWVMDGLDGSAASVAPSHSSGDGR